ncbi:MAG: hypothetical protein P4M12_04680 [Gammaproteobacteria bacterium]|nr:hypothetical protein [Gammaproteobacteria bacterium]
MKETNLIDLLKDKDFHIDTLGRVVIDNPEILSAINGAMKENADEMLFNGACTNSACR